VYRVRAKKSILTNRGDRGEALDKIKYTVYIYGVYLILEK